MRKLKDIFERLADIFIVLPIIWIVGNSIRLFWPVFKKRKVGDIVVWPDFTSSAHFQVIKVIVDRSECPPLAKCELRLYENMGSHSNNGLIRMVHNRMIDEKDILFKRKPTKITLAEFVGTGE